MENSLGKILSPRPLENDISLSIVRPSSNRNFLNPEKKIPLLPKLIPLTIREVYFPINVFDQILKSVKMRNACKHKKSSNGQFDECFRKGRQDGTNEKGLEEEEITAHICKLQQRGSSNDH